MVKGASLMAAKEHDNTKAGNDRSSGQGWPSRSHARCCQCRPTAISVMLIDLKDMEKELPESLSRPSCSIRCTRGAGYDTKPQAGLRARSSMDPTDAGRVANEMGLYESGNSRKSMLQKATA